MNQKFTRPLIAGALFLGLTLAGCADDGFDLTVRAIGMNGCEITESPGKVAYGGDFSAKISVPSGKGIVQVLENGTEITDYTLSGDTITIHNVTSPTTLNIIAGNPADYCILTTDLNSKLGGSVSSSSDWKVTKGSVVTLTAKTNKGGIFLGWTVKAPLSRGAEIVSTSEQIKVVAKGNAIYYANFDDSNVPIPVTSELHKPADMKFTNSVKITYHTNGGEKVKNSDKYTQVYGTDYFTMVNTLPDNGIFVREGYVLLGYSADKDGKSGIIPPGHKVKLQDGDELYCVWNAAEPTKNFSFTDLGSKVRLDKYLGSAKSLYIPRTINGRKVVEIAADCFSGMNFDEVIIPSTVTKLGKNSFNGSKIGKLTIHDEITSIAASGLDTKNIGTLTISAASYPRYSAGGNNFARKYERLVDCDTRRIVFVAGSSKFYGLDTDYAESLLDAKNFLGEDYRIVNFGTHAGMNIFVFFEFIANEVKDGDIIVYSPEQYAINTTGTSGNPELNALTFQGFESCYNMISSLDLSKYTMFFESFEGFVAQRQNMPEQNYEKHAKTTDVYGDCALDRRNMNSPNFHYKANGTFRFCDNFFNPDFLPNMNRVIDEAKSNGAVVYFSHPPYNKNACDPSCLNDESYDAYHACIKRDVDAKLISDVRNYIYGGEYFSNTDYHLNEPGSKLHTEQVIKDLKEALTEDGLTEENNG